jgi:hypothetical protein
VGIEIERVDVIGAEVIEDEPSSAAPPRMGPPIASSRSTSRCRWRKSRTGLFIIAFSMRFRSMLRKMQQEGGKDGKDFLLTLPAFL